MSDIIVRKSQENDASKIHALILELAEFEHGLNEVTVSIEDLKRDGFGDKPLFHSFVAEVEGEILGTAIYFFTYSTWNGKCLYLEDLIVKRNKRSVGVGEKLMKEVIKVAYDENVSRMAWQVLDWNVDAQDFYKKLGASLDSEWMNGRFNRRQIKSFFE